VADPGREGPVYRRVFLGLGSNLGDRLEVLRAAIAALPDLVAVSSVFETEPVGGPAGQDPYLNAVAELWSTASPRALLGLARRLEADAGRTRGVRWGARTLDVDVLLVGDLVVDEDDLVLPHPRLAERRFVCAPLAELAPELLPAGWEERAVGQVRRLGSLHELVRESDPGGRSGANSAGDGSRPGGRGSEGERGGPGVVGDAGRRAMPAGSGRDGDRGEERVVGEPTGRDEPVTAERSVAADPVGGR
jgi:2-amino-4-hydroxy-6-hydroxymethyldihydropteridine diphosphokinase